MVRFFAGVNHQRAAAAPVFEFGEAVYAIDIVAGIGACEGRPEEIIERSGGETAVIYDQEEGHVG